jgi:carboxyl-terminal processing protease
MCKMGKCPIVVLIDHGTAAGAEIVAGALQDLDRGLVVGKDSFGLGLIENVFALDDGSHLRLAIARFSTPSGRVIQRPPSKAEKKYAEGGSGDTAPESPPTTRPAFKTAKGRTVYGGGGINPDVLLEEKPGPTRLQIEMIQKRLFSNFAKHYVSQHAGVKWTAEELGPSFQLSDAEWTELRHHMEEEGFSVSDSLLSTMRPFIMCQVRSEVAGAALSSLDRYRILAEEDKEIEAALGLVSRAAELSSKGK